MWWMTQYSGTVTKISSGCRKDIIINDDDRWSIDYLASLYYHSTYHTTTTTTMSQPYQLAWQSIKVLSHAFGEALRGQDAFASSADTKNHHHHHLAGPCPIAASGQTYFYLFPNDSHHDTACTNMDWYILFYLTVVVHCISWGIRWVVWEPGTRALVRHLQSSSSSSTSTTHSKIISFDHDTVRKISMHLTEALFFILSGNFAYALFAHQPWLYQPHTWLDDCHWYHHNDTEQQVVPAAVKFYYYLYMARFLSDSVSLFFETGRNTTALLVALLHHTVTLGLIGVAVQSHYVRGAAVIMFFFDWADPPLLLAKSVKYFTALPGGGGGTSFQFLANRLFEVFAVTFFLSRNVLYTFVAYTFCTTLPAAAMTERIFLLLLVALQTYWMVLIAQAALRMSSNDGNVQEDARENKKIQK